MYRTLKIAKLVRAGFFFALLPIVLTGCGSLLSAAGPSRYAVTHEQEGKNYKLVELSAETIGPYMRETERNPSTKVAMPTVPEVRLVAGDVVRVMIADSAVEGAIFAPISAGGTVFDSVRVNSDGTITLPYVGKLSVAGKSPEAVSTLIHKKLKGISGDSQVQVTLTGDLSGSVLVAGAVKAPGRFSALQGPLTLLDAINKAGGPVLEPHLINVVVRTGSTSYQFNYQDLLSGKNQIIPPGAEIVLDRARKRFVAMGAVGDPGLHDLPSANPSLLEVLGSVKGLSEAKADAAGVFVFRLQDDPALLSDGKPLAQVFRLNMKEPVAMFLAKQFLVQPEDAIYVTNAAVYEWQKIISPIVQVLLLGRTVSNGF
ncbi:outer membrane protein involved in polysaccharide [Bordetella trematum]|uniref:polysaccharide biosynthesis/export family protein n=1 Tax=Bordetella trematum TaxID=123899 RepID=UPI000793EEA3|nr:polysaccharide biosynthesis/export family protein [Bordetella trematum]SAI28689.1 outer membrane protein involved in polysaccharide [Bordetella trematum]